MARIAVVLAAVAAALGAFSAGATGCILCAAAVSGIEKVTHAAQFLAKSFFSLAPGFSRVNRARRKRKRFQPFSAPAATKPLKRLGASPAPTGLKPGVNERLQESEMRPKTC